MPNHYGGGIAFRQSLLRATGSRVGARNDVVFLSGLLGVFALPLPQPFPTNLRKFSRRRHPRDLRAGTLANATIKVRKRHIIIAVNRLHGGLDQNPSQPGRTLPRDRTLVAVAAGLMNSRREARVGADLLGRAKTLDFADWRRLEDK